MDSPEDQNLLASQAAPRIGKPIRKMWRRPRIEDGTGAVGMHTFTILVSAASRAASPE